MRRLLIGCIGSPVHCCYVKVTSSCDIAVYSGTSVSLLKNEIAEYNVEQEKESIIWVMMGSK